MSHWCCVVYVLIVVQCARSDTQDNCLSCTGEEYECIDGYCFCSDGYTPDVNHNKCVKCPGLGDPCFGQCCSTNKSETLQCWHGTCQSCYGPLDNWICRDSIDQIILVSSTQIVMAVALVLGIIATFSLIYKLCKINNLRTLGAPSDEARLSVGSLQIYVDQRLRDAPPRYTSIAPPGSSIYPATIYLNAGFIHDNSLPPPLYTEESKNENGQNALCHI